MSTVDDMVMAFADNDCSLDEAYNIPLDPIPCMLAVDGKSEVMTVAEEFGRELLGAVLTGQEFLKWEHEPMLPFRAMLFHGSFLDEPSQRNMLVVNYDTDDRLNIYQVSLPAASHYGKGYGWMPVVRVRREHSGRFMAWAFPTVKPDVAKDKVHHLAYSCVHFMVGIYGMLNMKHFRKTTSEPSARVQSKREKRGQSPLSTTLHISLEPHVVAAYQGGTHASPRPHWRRGHVRLMANGKIVSVQPHMVMGEAPMPKSIKVSQCKTNTHPQ